MSGPELIRADGKYCRRGDPEHRPVSFAIGRSSVIYQPADPGDLTWCRVDLYGRHSASVEQASCDLIPIPTPPEMVPLEWRDVIPGKTLFRFGSDHRPKLLTEVNEGSFEIRVNAQFFLHPPAWFVQIGAMYSNDHGVTWSKCQKPKP